MSAKADGARVPVRYFSLHNPRTTAVSVVRVDRRWFTMQHCVRDDSIGRWPCTASPEPPEGEPPKPANTQFNQEGDRALRAIAPSVVLVEYDIPYRLDGVHGESFQGAGLVVDSEASREYEETAEKAAASLQALAWAEAACRRDRARERTP